MTLGLASAGIDVLAVDKNADGLRTLPSAGGLGTEDSGKIQALCVDLARADAFETIAEAAIRSFGRIDVLVNNAGIGQPAIRPRQREKPIRFWEVSPEQWNLFVTVNATAPIMLARAVLPHMLQAAQGRIIAVTTSLGTMVREGYLLYGASKAAAEASMAVLAADLAGTGVTANVLVPGGVTDTPLVGSEAGDRAKMLRPEIMLPPLLWLVSDAAGAINGRRFIAADWDTGLPAAQAAEGAGAPVAWLSTRGCRSSRPDVATDTLAVCSDIAMDGVADNARRRHACCGGHPRLAWRTPPVKSGRKSCLQPIERRAGVS